MRVAWTGKTAMTSNRDKWASNRDSHTDTAYDGMRNKDGAKCFSPLLCQRFNGISPNRNDFSHPCRPGSAASFGYLVNTFACLFTHTHIDVYYLSIILSPFGHGSKPTVPFGDRCTTHFVYLGGDWDVHCGYGVWTHGHLGMLPNLTPEPWS